MSENAEREFWMIYGVGRGAPTYKHSFRSDAITEAVRLARAAPGTKFYLLKAEDSFVVPLAEVRSEKLVSDEVPF